MAKSKKTTKKSTSAKVTAKKKTSTKSVNSKTVKSMPKTVAEPAASTSSSIRPGAIIFALLLLAIGIIGVIILQESNNLLDEANRADEANNTLLRPAETDVEASTTETAEEAEPQ